MMRLGDADLLPFDFGDFAETMQTYVKELKDLSKKMQDEIRERNREIDEGVFTRHRGPKKTVRSAEEGRSSPLPELRSARKRCRRGHA